MRYAGKENECSKRQLGQLARHERERSKHCAPVQPRFFPSLPPSRRRRACLERESNKRSRLQPMTLSTKISNPVTDSIVTTNVLESSSTTLLQNLNEDTTTIVSRWLSVAIMNQENPPQNLEEGTPTNISMVSPVTTMLQDLPPQNLDKSTTTVLEPFSPCSPGASYMTNMFQQMRNPNEGTRCSL